MNKQISLSVLNNELAQVRNKKKMLLKQIEHIAFGENCSPLIIYNPDDRIIPRLKVAIYLDNL